MSDLLAIGDLGSTATGGGILVKAGGKFVAKKIIAKVLGKGTGKVVLKSFDDIAANPKNLWGKSSDEVAEILGEGWTKGKYGSSGNGWKFIKGDMSIFYHPGRGRHGGSYYGFSSSKLCKNKIVDKNYKPTSNDKANIIWIDE